MADAIVGKWKENKSKSENMENFLASLGIPADVIAKMMQTESEFDISKEGNQYKFIHTATGHPPKTNYYELNKPFDLETPEGLKFKCVTTFEGGKYHQTFKNDQGEFSTTREINGNEMKSITTSATGSMTQYFTRC